MAKLQELALKYWWVLAIGAMAFAWLREHDAAVKARAVAETQLAQFQLMAETLKRFDKQLAQRDSQIVVLNQQLLASNAKIEVEKKAVKVQVASQVTALREQLTAEQQVKLDSITQNYDNLLHLADQQMANFIQLLQNDSTMLASRDTLLGQYRKQNTDQLAQIVRLTKQVGSNTSKLEKWFDRALNVGVLLYAAGH